MKKGLGGYDMAMGKHDSLSVKSECHSPGFVSRLSSSG